MNLLSSSEIRILDKLHLRSKKDLLGHRQGLHRSKRRGQGLEFSEYKEYSPGDDFRSIDWNTVARTEKLYSKIYREEQEVTSIILLDFSKSLLLSNQSEFSKKLALALYYISIRSGARALLVLPEKIITQPSSSPSSLNKIESLLLNSEMSGEFDISKSIKLCIAKIKLPAKFFIISDFIFNLENIYESLSLLKTKNFDSTLISLRSNQGILQGPLEDEETGEIVETEIMNEDLSKLENITNLHYKEVENICAKFQSNYFEIDKKISVDDFLFKELVRSRVLY